LARNGTCTLNPMTTPEEIASIKNQIGTLFEKIEKLEHTITEAEKNIIKLESECTHIVKRQDAHKQTAEGHSKKINKHGELIRNGIVALLVIGYLAKELGWLEKFTG